MLGLTIFAAVLILALALIRYGSSSRGGGTGADQHDGGNVYVDGHHDASDGQCDAGGDCGSD